MKIPDIAKDMREIAAQIEGHFPEQATNLLVLAENLKRRPLIRRAPKTSATMTDELREKIRQFVVDNPTMSHQQVGDVFNVNHGRVSEAVRGKRK